MPQQFRLINYDRVHTDITLHMKKKVLVEGMFLCENAIGDTPSVVFFVLDAQQTSHLTVDSGSDAKSKAETVRVKMNSVLCSVDES